MNEETALCSRRGFLKGATISALGLAGTSILGGCSQTQVSTAAESELQIYEGIGKGYMGTIKVNISVRGDKIEDLRMVESNERFYSVPSTVAGKVLRERVLNEQSLNVDVVSGATLSSNAILTAAKSALEDAGLSTTAFTKEVEKEREQAATEEVDILVVGGGFAGLTAALTAGSVDLEYKASGLKVMLVERCEFIGGSSAASGGGWSIFGDSRANEYVNAHITGEQLASISEELSGIEMNHPLINNMVPASGDTATKFFNLGSPFSVARAQNYAMAKDPARGTVALVRSKEYKTVGRAAMGIDATDHLLLMCKELGVDVRTGTDMVSLTMEEGSAAGVSVQTYDSEYTIKAKKVILACGGFARNKDMIKQYAPDYEGSVTFCGGGNTGDGINMAVSQADATIRGFGALAYPGTQTNGILGKTSSATHYGYGLWINNEGKRFEDDRQYFDTMYGSTNRTAKTIAAQPDHLAFNLFDSTASYASDIETAIATEDCGYKADTLEELADVIGVPYDEMMLSIENGNKAIELGIDTDFGVPIKYLNQVKTAPFYAVELRCVVIGTAAGLNVNESCQVLNSKGEVVPNLYATGEVMVGNLMSDYYLLSGGSLGNCMPTGRIAGDHAKATL